MDSLRLSVRPHGTKTHGSAIGITPKQREWTRLISWQPSTHKTLFLVVCPPRIPILSVDLTYISWATTNICVLRCSILIWNRFNFINLRTKSRIFAIPRPFGKEKIRLGLKQAIFATVNGLLRKLLVSPFSLPFSALIVSLLEVLNRLVYTVYIVVKRF